MASLSQVGYFFLVLLLVPVVYSTNKRELSCGGVNNGDSLQMMVVLFRHGDRTPMITYPTDPYQEETWMPWGGWGRLTQEGTEQQYDRGVWMRNCYGSFLNETYNAKDVYVRSTDVDRTLMSAEAHLAGVYTPKGFQIWSFFQSLASLWQPIAIHTIPQRNDYMLIPVLPCPPYDKLIEEIWASSPELNQMQRENQALLDYIAENAGLPMPGNLRSIADIMGDTVAIERLKGLVLPEWLNKTVQEKLDMWKDIWRSAELSTDEMIRYASGELVAYFQDTLTKRTQGLGSEKHIILSAHDHTVTSLLAAYGDPGRMEPPYAATVIHELHLYKPNGRYFVRVFYQNDTKTDPYPVSIRNCVEPCWMEQYVSEIQPFRISNKSQVCYPPSTTIKPDDNDNRDKEDQGLDQNTIITIAVSVSAVCIVLVLTIIITLKLKNIREINKKEKQKSGNDSLP